MNDEFITDIEFVEKPNYIKNVIYEILLKNGYCTIHDKSIIDEYDLLEHQIIDFMYDEKFSILTFQNKNVSRLISEYKKIIRLIMIILAIVLFIAPVSIITSIGISVPIILYTKHYYENKIINVCKDINIKFKNIYDINNNTDNYEKIKAMNDFIKNYKY